MGEPVTLYDKNGKAVTVYGPATMKAALDAGATLEKPAAKSESKTADKPAKSK